MIKWKIVFLFACMLKTFSGQSQTKTINYLALGDSYTSGESVKQEESFPFQLSKRLNEQSKFKVAETKDFVLSILFVQSLLFQQP